VRSGLGQPLCLGPAATDLLKDALGFGSIADPRRLLRHALEPGVVLPSLLGRADEVIK
jgi:hypothetical protein